jgi:peptidoglycan/xylan/chitin deacetylase (PgdA/CDA1 family)
MFERIRHDPAIIGKYFYPQIIWETRCRKLLVTFDDGPNPGSTEIILKTLNTNKIKAVFFCNGSNAAKNPELVRLIHSEGHTIASHSLNHLNLRELLPAQIVEEITTSGRILSEITGQPVKYFRPPYGRFNRHVLRAAKQNNQTAVLWSLICPDYKNDVNLVKFALRFLRYNSIIVMHDNPKSEKLVVDEVTMLIEKALALQFEFGDPLECLK